MRPGVIAGSTPPPTLWPYPYTATRDITGIGPSTMEGQMTGTRAFPPFYYMAAIEGATYYGTAQATPNGSGQTAAAIPNSGGVMVANRGIGGATNNTIATTYVSEVGTKARLGAADLIAEWLGNYDATLNPIPYTIANDVNRVEATHTGSRQILWAPWYNNNEATGLASSGGTNWTRTQDFLRRMRSSGRLVEDTVLAWRHYSTGNSADDTYQALDMTPNSLMVSDRAHLTGAGSAISAQLSFEPYREAAETGGLPLIPNQRQWSRASTNQTNGGLVCTLQTETGANLSGLVLTSSDANFSFAVEAGVLTCRRATSTYLLENYYDVALTEVLNNKSRTSWVRIWMTSVGADTNAHRVILNSQALIKEGLPGGAAQDATAFSMAFSITPMSGWNAAVGTPGNAGAEIFRSFVSGAGGVIIEITTGFLLRIRMFSSTGATILTLTSPIGSGNLINEANGERHIFIWANLASSTASLAFGATSGALATASSTATTSRMFPNNINLLFGLGPNGTFPHPLQMSCIAKVGYVWMAQGLVNFTDTTPTNRILVRNPSTNQSVLNTTRGSDAPGVVNGVSPFLWMEGRALAAGINLAAPNDDNEVWPVIDRAKMTLEIY